MLSLKLFERLALEPSLKGWEGLGLAVQAYQKRTRALIERLTQLARQRGTHDPDAPGEGRVLGWRSEARANQGRVDFPVWTTKAATDVHYLACARDLFRAGGAIFPQFATHNAHTVAAVRRMAASAGRDQFEFQRLHGMGEALYRGARTAARRCACMRRWAGTRICCRIWCGACWRTAPTPVVRALVPR